MESMEKNMQEIKDKIVELKIAKKDYETKMANVNRPSKNQRYLGLTDDFNDWKELRKKHGEVEKELLLYKALLPNDDLVGKDLYGYKTFLIDNFTKDQVRQIEAYAKNHSKDKPKLIIKQKLLDTIILNL